MDLWRKATNVVEEKQGPVLILNMSGKAQDIALNLPNTNLENVLKEMEVVYGDSMELVTRYEEFDAFNRTTDQTIKEYIHMFEQQIATLKTLKLDIPNLILAIKLLKGVNLPENEKKMARLACETMTFEEAKNSLLVMTDDVDKISSKNGVVSVKREQMDGDTFTFYNEENVCTRCQSSVNLEDQGEEVMYTSQKRYYQSKGRGPIKKKRRCFRCGSLRHWVKECPEKIRKIVRSKQDYNSSNHPPNRRHRIYYEEVDESESEDEQPTDESSRAIFFQSDVGNEVEDILLVGQTINQAVLDCGASQTVCGTEWYQCYLDSLGDEQLNQITESPSSTVFKFGVGSLKALKQASIPVTICGRNIFFFSSDSQNRHPSFTFPRFNEEVGHEPGSA